MGDGIKGKAWQGIKYDKLRKKNIWRLYIVFLCFKEDHHNITMVEVVIAPTPMSPKVLFPRKKKI